MSFPNEPFFRRLIQFANGPPRIIISDDISGVRVTYRDLLSGVLRFRQILLQSLPPDAVDSNQMIRPNVYIGILAPASVEFTVAFLTILSLGGVITPLSTTDSPQAICERMTKCNAACVVYSPQQAELMWFTRLRAQVTTGKEVCLVAISAHPGDVPSNLSFIAEQTTGFLSTRTALLLFTSGTTGQPKGVLHSRRFFDVNTDPVGQEDDALLFTRVAGYIGSIRLMVIMLLRGIRIELWPYLADPNMLWERLRQGGITILHLPPMTWRTLMLVYRDRLSKLPLEEQEEYYAGARQLREATAGGQVMLQEVKAFWCDMLEGRCVTVIYGGTEMGISPFKAHGSDSMVERVIGKPVPGVEFKLSGGDKGELLVKTPALFAGYLDNPEATRKSFDEEGFFRTGDIVRLNGIIATLGGMVSAPKIREALIGLPEVKEGYIFGIQDQTYVNQVAALVRLQEGRNHCREQCTFDLAHLRRGLAHLLSEHELPTLLRLVTDGEVIPHSVSGKLMYGEARKQFFSMPLKEDATLHGVQDWLIG
ncbi:NRPS-like protein biosynthetic cluster [Penicillium canariense]|uniref:NRPS-like protein biosynthetic cluster n=1 Tax=Penicillium canariense TaxID=189055 RepID=A0A9W9LSX8_9EURO|nr:NRPS-like protein biosynthetic cluster [Penicillium canariense]KAJ5175401.1 NRPS-like protein biosynthetic cluster [Penicillium canariense]